MADADGAPEPIYAFPLDRVYLFGHFFDRPSVFDALKTHYDDDAYRFEVPEREWEAVASTLRDHGYDPVVVDDPEAFVVVTERYAPHAEILKRSVAHWTRRGHRFFLMRDPLAVERAVSAHDATPAAETDLAVGI